MAAPRDRATKSSDPAARPGDMPTLPPLEGETSSQVPSLPAAPLAATALEVPGYEIRGELGRGGMGVVYLANKLLMKRLVVLKVVNKALLDANPEMLDRFVREIEVAARLDHENVVKAYHAFWAGELLVFEMEYVEGEDLAKLVKRQGPLPVAHACHYVCQAAMGLQAAHLLGMVHRDIKPHNLILTRRGKRPVVKILDFGLAKAVRSEETATDLTGLGMLGTPAFMAPEQAVDAARADIRADIYGLGCTLYYLLTGNPPFSGNSHFAVLKAHESEAAPSLTKLRPEAPAELEAIATKMLAKDPAKRYQQPIDVGRALAPIIKTAVQSPKEKPPVPAKEAGPAPTKTAKPPVVSPSFWDTATAPPVRRDAPPPVVGPASETETVVPSPRPKARPAPHRRSSAGVWFMKMAGVLGIMFLAAAGGASLLFFSGPAPSTSSAGRPEPSKLSPKENLVPVSEPARAVAPFDAAQAKRFQQAWAEYLQVQVVREVNLGGATMKLTLIPPGTFLMGGNGVDYSPQHRVTITKGFWMGIHPVTQAQWQAVMGYNPSSFPGPDRPVETVSWDDCQEFCQKTAELTNKPVQLPTEAEWEYACRAGTTGEYFSGNGEDALKEVGWYDGHSGTHVVGKKQVANPWGLFDVHGNVWECCQDLYAVLGSADISDPVNLNNGDGRRVIRGGSWVDWALYCRAAFRVGYAPDSRSNAVGLRVCFRLD